MILLMGGGCIYLLQRPASLLLFRVTDALGLTERLDAVRTDLAAWPEFVVYNLPGALWSGSYVLLADMLFRSFPLSARLLWASVIPMLGLLSELLQFVGLCPGTPDVLDALCYVLPYIIYVIFVTR
jgi:hypothetical protein